MGSKLSQPQRKCRVYWGAATRQDHPSGKVKVRADSHFGPETNRSAEPDQGQLENRNVTIKSHLTYMNLNDGARPSKQTPRGDRDTGGVLCFCINSRYRGEVNLSTVVLPKLPLLRSRAMFSILPLTREGCRDFRGAMAAMCRRQA